MIIQYFQSNDVDIDTERLKKLKFNEPSYTSDDTYYLGNKFVVYCNIDNENSITTEPVYVDEFTRVQYEKHEDGYYRWCCDYNDNDRLEKQYYVVGEGYKKSMKIIEN